MGCAELKPAEEVKVIGMRYWYDGISVQNCRKSNMDSLLLKERCVEGQNLCLAIVCDGVGSLENGSYASSFAVQELSRWMDQVENTQRLGLRFQDRIMKLNQEIIAIANQYNFKTASTISALLLDGEQYYLAHAGDSRIYKYEKERLVALTPDHVVDGKLRSCLGISDMHIFYDEGPLDKDIFLICSDGLYKRMNPSVLTGELMRMNRKHLKNTLENLAKYVINQGEKDNVSIAVVISER